MKIVRSILWLVFLSFLPLFNNCDDDEEKEIYLEGEPIPGIEIVFPLGYYSPEPMMPKISPDGKKLLFTGPSELPEWKGLWVMDFDTQQKKLLHSNGRNADWATDSEWLAFNIGSEIYKMNIDGSGLSRLIEETGFFEPAWSPNGDVIYFGGNQGAGIVSTDGSGLMIIPELGGQGSWHPNGQKIISSKEYSAMSGWRKFPVYDLSINQVEIIYDVVEEINQFPKFSKDGSMVLFYNDLGIYIMNSNGSDIKRISPSHLYGDKRKENPKIYSGTPYWHPDGLHIIYEHFKITRSDRTAFGRRVEGVIQFYKVNAYEAMAVSNLK